jgi:ABC-type nitrate/sulfonate/bicarbonate transport system permease component
LTAHPEIERRDDALLLDEAALGLSPGDAGHRVAGRQRRNWARDTVSTAVPALIGFAALLAVWEAWVKLRHVKPYLLPAPDSVASRLYEDPTLFAREGMKTLEGAMLGFALGGIIAILLATLMAQSR